MTKETYEKITYPFREHPRLAGWLKAVNKVITLGVYFLYTALAAALAFRHDVRFLKVLLVPGISFIMVSAARSFINAPRPYEKLDIDPIIYKNTQGRSFPSRHVFAIFVIAMALYYISSPLGIALMLMGILLAAIRVIGGVHFAKDVIAGAAIGIICGVIGFYLI